MSFLEPIKATGTVWCIEILDKDFDVIKLQSFTEDFLETFEQKYSRFRETSWLSELNNSGIFKDSSEEFRELLSKSVQMYRDTDGVFNIAVGKKMTASGYGKDHSFDEFSTYESPVLTEVLFLEDNEIILKDAVLDLGGIGKGFLVDKLATAYKDIFGLDFFIINGGGDIYVTSDYGEPIAITLAHPLEQKQGIGTVALLNQGFAASSPYLRVWKDKKTGKQHNHLHSDNQVASYVVADTVCVADVWATTLAINPEQKPQNVECLLLKGIGVLHADTLFQLNKNEKASKRSF